MEAQEAEQCIVEWATAIEQKLNVAQAHLVETEVALGECLEALKAEQNDRADVEQWVL